MNTKKYKYLGAAGLVGAGFTYWVIIDCPPMPLPHQWLDDDDSVSGHGGFAGQVNGSAGMGGSVNTGGFAGSTSGSAGSGGLPQHPCTTGDHPNISNAEQLCDLVKSASHCLNTSIEWQCYCEANVITFGCNTCLVAFPDKDLSVQTLTQFTQILGVGNVEFVRCPSNTSCIQPSNRRNSVVVDSNICTN